jgi:hypothetical protein
MDSDEMAIGIANASIYAGGNMKTTTPNRSSSGITMIDALVLIAIIMVLATMLWPRGGPKLTPLRIRCINNLKQISLAFRIWQNDHSELYPWEVSTNAGGTKEYAFGPEMFRHFQCMSNEMGEAAQFVLCPADNERIAATNFADFSNSNVSYFLGVTVAGANTNGNLFLSGDRNLGGPLQSLQGIYTLATNAPLGWSPGIHSLQDKPAGNILFSDGRVQQFSTPDLQKALRQPGVAGNVLVFP